MFNPYSEIFQQRAGAYHGAMAACPHARDAEFMAMIEPLGDVAGLLCDVPSGGGYLAAHLPAGTRYIGVDPSDEFIDACPPGLERLKADITDVPLGDGSVDAIVSLAGLHHEPDLGAVFREMRRLLRRSGRAIIAAAAVNTPPARFLNGFVDANNPMGHDGHFLDERTAGLIEAEGFRIVEDRQVDMPWVFDSLAEAGNFCRQLFWMPDLDASAVADAMGREIGFEVIDGRPYLRWALRRIVCDAA